ncbi:MAG: glycine cleavage system aminomethyltransferase GcvT [Gemmatimonadota bacterium]|nr:glycine cleavage system aminomethyltransferase GcvT [Gemmatimonadota bacterium]
MSDLKHTPLYDAHVALGGRMVPFAGFAMPVQYPSGIRAEHEAVRTAAGLFDVSHMGEFLVTGPDALDFVSYATSNDPARLSEGQVQYSVMCLESGGIVDDLLVYRLGDQRFRLVVNAANLPKDWEHLSDLSGRFDVQLEDESDRIGLVALQGPQAQAILAPLASEELDPIGFYEFVSGQVAGVPGVISRTGYTGEDGFELYVPAGRTLALWAALLEAGEPHGLVPAGLGARDSLRLEMGYALYGNDIDEETTPLEAGLGWLVKLAKDDFHGKAALERQKAEGLRRRLRGFRLDGQGFPRPGYDLVFGGEVVGPVRSGTVSPTLGVGIGTAYLPADAAPGDSLAVRIRGRDIEGHVAKLPFWDRGSVRK